MSNPTTPFSWQMPTNTDLVTDLPADFEVFGQAVATSMQDLLGGTTGQVLAKASNADMDFVWSADAAGMTNPMTTTGDVIYSSPGSTPVRLGIGSAGQVLTVASGLPSWATPAAPSTPYSIFRDEKSNGTNGGTFTSGAWRTRDINATQINQISGSSIASNQITLPAGTFYISANPPAAAVDANQARLYNITDSSVAILGVSTYSGQNPVQNNSTVEGIIVLASSKVFELQHQCNTTTASYGFGLSNGFGNTQVYSIITIAKVG